MNYPISVFCTVLVALLFVCTLTDGAKYGTLEDDNGSNDSTNATLIKTSSIEDESKTPLQDNLNTDSSMVNSTKVLEKSTSYPKKVHSLKKRPTKTPATHSVLAVTQNTKTKRKKVTDVTAAFKDLPADDLEFIKQLDHQFQLHGEMIKIKVEHDNSTDVGKQNSKRTIDGELGYGAYQAQSGYQYVRPKFMFYPYSQHNIPADAPGYYPPKTDVSIEPSYSYELQPQSYVQEHAHDAEQVAKVLDVPQHASQSHVGYEEPVIVLRIPGPTKYASHLQSLLQQYLEIRAAQYLRILEETELQKHQVHQTQSQQSLEQHQHHQLEQHEHLYKQQAHQQHSVRTEHAQAEPTLELQPPIHEKHAIPQQPAGDNEHGYSPEVAYAHYVETTPQPVTVPEIDDIYQSYKGKSYPVAIQQQHEHQQSHQIAYGTQQHEEEKVSQNAQHEQGYFVTVPQQPATVQQFYYTPHAHFGLHGSQHYQNVYFMALTPQPNPYQAHSGHTSQEAMLQNQPIYVQEEEQERELQQQQQEHKQNELLASHATAATLSENNPRQTHTKVVYTHKTGEKGAEDYASSYTLPSIRPYERHATTSATAAAYHRQQQLQEQMLYDQQQHREQLQQQQQKHQISEQEHEQRSAFIEPQPFNYHAHSAITSRRVNRKRGAPIFKPITTVTTDVQVDDHLQKIRDFVRENLGAQMSTAVEFKTTAVVKT